MAAAVAAGPIARQLVFALAALVSCSPVAEQAVAGPSHIPSAAAAVVSPSPTPQPTHVQYFVPVTNATAVRDEVPFAGLTEVLAPASHVAAVSRLLPAARVEAVEDVAIVPRVRASAGAIALLPPEAVDVSVKTLSVDGRFFWDRSLALADYPLAATERGAAPSSARDQLWSLVAGGGIIFGRGVQERVERYRDPSRPFAKVRDLTRAADVALATLEAPLSREGNRYCQSCLVFVGNESYISAIVDAGFDVLSLAANHSGDAGPAGVLDSIRVARAAGIATVGAGADEASARQPAFLQVRGLRVAFLAYVDVPPASYAATVTRPGHARLSHDDPGYERIRAEVAAARAQADLVIVVPHWGIEYEDQPRPWIRAAAEAMLEAGADVILADHPHWVQSVETRNGRYVAYSLGNFIFDQMWSAETRQGSLHQLFFIGRRLVSARIRPTLLEDYHQPRLLDPGEPAYQQTLQRIWRRSVFE
ncbi:MAG: CapA family protein [Chloroflexota bacterium]|nr:CapA family protein [Chloroflexota bacterium]